MIRKTQQCLRCNAFVSLSNFSKHVKSISCSNGGKNKTRKEKHPWAEWKVNETTFRMPCGYEGTKKACTAKLNAISSIAQKGIKSNFDGYMLQLKSGERTLHNKGKLASTETRKKLSQARIAYAQTHSPRLHTEEFKRQASERKKKLYAENPEKHPNAKLAGNRAKMTYPEMVAFDWFKEQKIEAPHNKRVDRFYPDFIVGNIIVEIDGEQWHSSVEQKDRDRKRDEILVGFGYSVYRIPAKANIRLKLQEIFK